ncbi:MAG: very short patch repair endonuclease [Tissierellales bacterium]|nr:very short patch repair endonuclease [Tissierellales bacterium]
MDNLTKEQRRKNMQAIRSRNTGIEVKLRKELWHRGYRYRIHYKKLPGKPDIVFVKQRIAVFCDSEFFHGFNWSEQQKNIKSHRDYWIPKIESNIQKDRLITEQLEKDGWLVLRFWGKEIQKNPMGCIDKVEKSILDRMLPKLNEKKTCGKNS